MLTYCSSLHFPQFDKHDHILKKWLWPRLITLSPPRGLDTGLQNKSLFSMFQFICSTVCMQNGRSRRRVNFFFLDFCDNQG